MLDLAEKSINKDSDHYKSLEQEAAQDCTDILAVKARELEKKQAVVQLTMIENREIQILMKQKRKDALKAKKTQQLVVAKRVILKASKVLNKKKKEKAALLLEAEARKKKQPVKKTRIRITINPNDLEALEEKLLNYENKTLHKLGPFLKVCMNEFMWTKTKCFKVFEEFAKTTSFKLDNKKEFFTI